MNLVDYDEEIKKIRKKAVKEVIALIMDDKFASQFQSLGGYRNGLIKECKNKLK